MQNPFSSSFIHLSVNETTHQVTSDANLITLGEVTISHSDDFNHFYIKNDLDESLGLIIGNPVKEDAFIKSDIRLSVSDWTNFEDYIYSLTGRYVVIGRFDCKSRLYLDASGSLPIVYEPSKKVASSSSVLIYGDRYESKLDAKLLKQLGLPKSGLWIPSGKTAHKGLHRVLPNHYLDLDQWILIRHWPVTEISIQRDSDVDELIHSITSNAENTCKAIASSHTPAFSLTAGRDSRMLLACTKQIAGKSKFFTFYDFPGSVDSYTSKKIAREFNLNHAFLNVGKPPKNYKDHWLRWNGHSISGGVWNVQHSLRKLEGNYAVLPAMAGEVGRAFYWKENDKETHTLKAPELLNRLQLPVTNALLDATQKYINNLPDTDFFSLLDLVYIEQRLGCWGNLSMYTGNFYAPHYLPLSSREIFTSMMKLPHKYRFQQKLSTDLISAMWPDLLHYPFNEYQGLYKLKKAVDYAFLVPSFLFRKYITNR